MIINKKGLIIMFKFFNYFNSSQKEVETIINDAKSESKNIICNAQNEAELILSEAAILKAINKQEEKKKKNMLLELEKIKYDNISKTSIAKYKTTRKVNVAGKNIWII